MTSGYNPPQRALRAAVLSGGTRWIEGTFHVPRLHAFDEHLGSGRAFLSLTDVALGDGATSPFLALRASAAHVIVPACRLPMLRLAEIVAAREVSVTCYLERISVRGTLRFNAGVRTSDFLARRDGFLVLRDAALAPAGPGPGPHPAVLVHADAVIAIAEDGDAADPPADGALLASPLQARPAARG